MSARTVSREVIAIGFVLSTHTDQNAATFALVRMMLTVILPMVHAHVLQDGLAPTALLLVVKECMERTANTNANVKMGQSVIQPQASVTVCLDGVAYFVTPPAKMDFMGKTVKKSVTVSMVDLVTQ